MSIRSKKYTQAARGQQCTLQIAGVCNHNPETVVFAHFPDEGHGMGIKADDFIGGDCCSACHDAIDGRVKNTDFDGYTKDFYLRRSMTRTIRRRIEAGILELK